MELKEYILDKVKKANALFKSPKTQIAQHIQQNKDDKFRYDNYKKQNTYSDIVCNKDVELIENRIPAQIKIYENMLDKGKKLYPTDYFQINMIIDEYISAIQKVANCLENSYCNFEYSIKSIDDLFNRLDNYSNQLNELSMRSVCQD